MTKPVFYILIVFLLLFENCILFAQEPAGDRIMSMQIDLAANENFENAFKYADSACVKVIHMSFPWVEVEKDTNNWDLVRLDSLLKQARTIPGLMIELNLPPLNMGWKKVPIDLIADSLSSVRTRNRYKAFIDTVFNYLQNIELYTLNIGNEHGLYLLEQWPDTSRIVHFKTFHKEMATYAKSKYAAIHQGKNLPIGTTLTYTALVHTNTWWFMKNLNNELSDVISCNYYGIYNDGTVKDSSLVREDFDSLLSIYGGEGKPILITECGYPSGDTCNSSEEKQAQFVETIFSSWDQYKDDIKYVSFFTLADWPWEIANYITDAMGIAPVNQATFRDYLRTLGWRNYDGTPKQSMQTIINGAKKRCFCFPTSSANANTNQSITIGDSAMLVASGGETYQWSTDETNDTIYVKPDQSTTYYVTVSDVNQCSSSVDSVTVAVNAVTNIDKKTTITADEYGLKVYPNPARNSFMVEFSPKNNYPWMLKVIDIQGKIHYLQKGFGENGIKLEVATHEFSSGVYSVILWIENNRFTKNVMIESN